MKLIMENWKRFVNEADYRSPQGGGAPGDPGTSTMVYTANRIANALRSRNLHQDVDHNTLYDLISPSFPRHVQRMDLGADDAELYMNIHTAIQELRDEVLDSMPGRDEREKSESFAERVVKDIFAELASYEQSI